MDLKNDIFIKRENSLLRQNVLENAIIESRQNVNLHPGLFQISAFLKDIHIFQVNIHEHNIFKSKENS